MRISDLMSLDTEIGNVNQKNRKTELGLTQEDLLRERYGRRHYISRVEN